MIIVKLHGGVGNQMFQYAAAKSLALRLQQPLRLDTSHFHLHIDRLYSLHVFPNITESFISEAEHRRLHSTSFPAKMRRKFGKMKFYREPHFHVDPNFFSLKAPVNLVGVFQSEKYFVEHENEIRNQFQLDEETLSERTLLYLQAIETSNSISVHFRRGDYVTRKETSDLHGTCSRAYYENSIALMTARFPNTHFFVFSDEIQWVMNQDLFSGVEHAYIERTANSHDSEDVFLMSRCAHNIVANSSFSWWGAWLNNSPDKVVIAPENWFRTTEHQMNDLIPESWNVL